jgi:hypothetical protein
MPAGANSTAAIIALIEVAFQPIRPLRAHHALARPIADRLAPTRRVGAENRA